MSERLKQRIVGAIVLVSLAVIFLPMILDGSGQKRDLFVQNPIPTMPGYKFEPLDIPIKSVRPTTKPARIVENEQHVKQSELKTNKPTTLKPLDENAQRLVEAWIVQVGSFTKSHNAFSLRDRLRKKDLRVFVEQLNNNDNQSFYRVRVGPYKLRLEAEAAQAKIKNSYKIDGKIMKHP